ncbi:MAG TPA: DUF4380 domain-containing protein [Arachnia sp.]|nr:DUF4380 domain-containing protein [Arachnia sp.]
MSARAVVRLRRGDVEVAVAPRLGGRTVSMRFGGHEFLWRNPALLGSALEPLSDPVAPRAGAGFADWQNWGGDKTWPAPQGWSGPGEWPGPPDPVLDAGAYRLRERTPTRVVVESGTDPRTGLRIRRDVGIAPDGSVVVSSTLTNESSSRARWAAWGVAQLAFESTDVETPESYVRVSSSGGRDPVTLFAPLGRIRWAREDDAFRIPLSDVVGKIGFPDATGEALLHRRGRPGLRLTFAVEPKAAYPDGCPFQLWMQTIHAGPLPGLEGLATIARLVEFEPTSPVAELEPGAQVTLGCTWTIR